MAVERSNTGTTARREGEYSSRLRRFALRALLGRLPCAHPRTTHAVDEEPCTSKPYNWVSDHSRLGLEDNSAGKPNLDAGHETKVITGSSNSKESTSTEQQHHREGAPPRASTVGEGSTSSSTSSKAHVDSGLMVLITTEAVSDNANTTARSTGTASEHSATSPGAVKVKRLPGSDLLQEYMVERTLGRGTSGKVCLCRSIRTGDLYALKSVRGVGAGSTYKRNRLNRKLQPSEQSPCPVTGEAMSLGLPTHPNLLRVLEVIPHEAERPEAGAQVVMEPAMGGELSPSAFRRPNDGSLDEAALAAAARGALAGLSHLHTLGVVHGDLKLGNLLSGGVEGRCCDVKVADLGCAVRFPPHLPPSQWWVVNRPAGTPAYLAPEQTTEAPYLGPPADVWAMGVCLYQLASGRLPFRSDSIIGLYDAIARCGGGGGGPVEELAGAVSPALEALLRGMLQREAAERLTLLQVMEHEWFTDNVSEPQPSDAL